MRNPLRVPDPDLPRHQDHSKPTKKESTSPKGYTIHPFHPSKSLYLQTILPHNPIPSLGEEDSQEDAVSYLFDPIPRPTYGNDVILFFEYIYEHFMETLGPQTRATQMFFQLLFCNNMDELGITIDKKREAIQEVSEE